MMDEMYGNNNTNNSNPAVGDYSETPENLILPSDYHSFMMNSSSAVRFGSDELISATISDSAASVTRNIVLDNHHHHNNNINDDDDNDNSASIKAKIASHPHYPRLLRAYIDCHKVGAPPEIARILEEIGAENDMCSSSSSRRRQGIGGMGGRNCCIGSDPELDDFMDCYCEILNKYKLDLSKPFDEATSFLSDIESQLRNLSKGAFVRSSSAEEGAVSSDEECSGGEVEIHDVQPKDEERDLKDQLLRRFGSHISSLKLEFSKKKKKGKLPREARQLLFEWWNAHYKWPYPTEGDKIALAEMTGLDQRQINNWFINQRKRHWKPSENMQFALMDNISGPYFTDD